MSYRIEPYIHKSWFSGPSVRYKIIRKYQQWYDPSYGNGGGEWIDRERVETTVDTFEEATKMLNQLNIKGND